MNRSLAIACWVALGLACGGVARSRADPYQLAFVPDGPILVLPDLPPVTCLMPEAGCPATPPDPPDRTWTITGDLRPIPEPGSLGPVATALAALALVRPRRRPGG